MTISLGSGLSLLMISQYFLNNSLVFLATVGKKKILYTGDIEKIAEEQIIKRIEGIEIDYLKVAHHGSKSSTTDIFLNNINCKNFIISCRYK